MPMKWRGGHSRLQLRGGCGGVGWQGGCCRHTNNSAAACPCYLRHTAVECSLLFSFWLPAALVASLSDALAGLPSARQ